MRQLTSHSLVGLHQVVFVLNAKAESVKEVMTAQCGCGVMGVGGNKGGQGTSLKVAETRIVLINSHLAASQNKVEKRNANVSQIMQ